MNQNLRQTLSHVINMMKYSQKISPIQIPFIFTKLIYIVCTR